MFVMDVIGVLCGNRTKRTFQYNVPLKDKVPEWQRRWHTKWSRALIWIWYKYGRDRCW